MNHFHRVRGELYCEDVPLERIAAKVGTPTYVYSTATLRRHLRVMSEAFGGAPHQICYAVKASSNLALLKLLHEGGAGFDIVSGGELARVLAATGGDGSRVVFSGVGKTKDEMAQGLRARILMFNVESEEELYALDEVARKMRVRAPFALRVNPDVDPKTHRHIATGLRTSKFGIPIDQARSLYKKAQRLPGLLARGVDCHIGSQLTQVGPLREAVSKVAALYQELSGLGLPLRYLDVGGGLGISYQGEEPPSPAQYAKVVIEAAQATFATLVLEPGRVLVGNAAVLLTNVLYRKQTPNKLFVIVDAGMNDLIRPALYEAHHEVVPVKLRRGARKKVELVGPVCESTDVLARDRMMVVPNEGELLAVLSAGAYGMSMASTYNSRRRPAEVLVEGAKFRVVRARETYEALWQGEAP